MQTLRSTDELQDVTRVTSLKSNSRGGEEWMELGDEGEKSGGEELGREEEKLWQGNEKKTNK